MKPATIPVLAKAEETGSTALQACNDSEIVQAETYSQHHSSLLFFADEGEIEAHVAVYALAKLTTSISEKSVDAFVSETLDIAREARRTFP